MAPKEHSLHILKRLSADPELTQRALAKELGISVGKTNYCVRALVEKGLVKAGNFRNSRNKLAYAYFLTPQGIEEKARLTVDFLKIKLAEYETLRQEIEALRAEAAQTPFGQQEFAMQAKASDCPSSQSRPFASTGSGLGTPNES